MAEGDLHASGGRELCLGRVARDDLWQRGIRDDLSQWQPEKGSECWWWTQTD